jgi:DHA3 family macrolide efflux protein-like MFS transporter
MSTSDRDPKPARVRAENDVRGYPDFMKVWRGQTVSVFGSQMAAFAISIWIYRETGSVIQFGAVIAAQLVPTILFAPVTGMLVDRFHRRNVMLGAEIGLIAASLLLYVLVSIGELSTATIMAFSPLIALFGSVHQVAYASSIPLLVPRPAYGRANGFVQLGINGSAAIVPLIAVFVLEELGLGMVILLNVFTYLTAAVSLAFVRFQPMPVRPPKQDTGFSLRRLIGQQFSGVGYMLRHRTLLVLVMFLCAVNFLNGIVLVLFRPLILSTETATVLGTLVTIAGIGGLAGAIVAATVSGRGDNVRKLLLASAVSGISMACCGASTHLGLVAVMVFVFSFSAPFILVAAQTLMQTVTPVEIQGRVFASRSGLASVALILAVLISPWLSEHVFGPLLAEGRLLADLARFYEGGTGTGMRMVFVLAGLGMVGLCGLAWQQSQFRALRQLAQGDGLPQPSAS